MSKDAKSFLKHVIKALTVNGRVLLAVAWVTDKGRLYHQQFPYVLGMDVTFGTNAEKHPLFRASSKTSNNNNVPLKVPDRSRTRQRVLRACWARTAHPLTGENSRNGFSCLSSSVNAGARAN